jgi:hypothetical protein
VSRSRTGRARGSGWLPRATILARTCQKREWVSFTETVHASSEVSERTFKSTRAPVPALAHELVTKSPEAERQVRGRRQRGRRHAEPRETLGHRSCVGGVEGVKHIGRVAMRESVDPMRAAWVRGAPRMQIVPDEGAIRGNQRQSEAIRGNQRQSEAINGRHASKSYHSPSERNQRQSEATRGNQRQSMDAMHPNRTTLHPSATATTLAPRRASPARRRRLRPQTPTQVPLRLELPRTQAREWRQPHLMRLKASQP